MTKLKRMSAILELNDGHKHLTTSQLRNSLAESVSYVASNSGVLVLTKNGAKKAAIVSIEDLWILDTLGAQYIKAHLKVAARYEPELLRNILRPRVM